MSVRCKMLCESKVPTLHDGEWRGENIVLRAVWEGTAADGLPACEENKRFSKATPSAVFQIYIENKPAADFYEVGKCYYLDSEPAGDKVLYSEGWALDPETQKYRDPDTGALQTWEDGPSKAYQARTAREHQARLDAIAAANVAADAS